MTTDERLLLAEERLTEQEIKTGKMETILLQHDKELVEVKLNCKEKHKDEAANNKSNIGITIMIISILLSNLIGFSSLLLNVFKK
jgi:hypothetical protein